MTSRFLRLGIVFLFLCTFSAFASSDPAVTVSILSILQPKQISLTLFSANAAAVQTEDGQLILPAKLRIDLRIRGDRLYWLDQSRAARSMYFTCQDACEWEVCIADRINRRYTGNLRISILNSTMNIVLEPNETEMLSSITASEMGEFRNPEALKAFAVVARSFLRGPPRHPERGADFCDTTHCQVFQSYRATPEARKAVQETSGLILTYRENPFRPFYSRSCGGTTATHEEVWHQPAPDYPFASVTCPCNTSWTTSIHNLQIKSLTGFTPAQIKCASAGIEIQGNGKTALYNYENFRILLGRQIGWNEVKSNWFDANLRGDHIIFSGKGIGHRVGFCQTGADTLAGMGQSFQNILSRYFPGTEIRLNQ